MTKDTTVEVHGFANGGFEPLKDVFGRMIAAQGGGGAAVAIHRDGVPVVDLYGGAYRRDSLQLLFSVSKLITALAVARAQEQGKIDVDAPLADCWPQFGRASTATITLRDVMSHRSGLAAADADVDLAGLLTGEDERAIEAQEPFWEPGRAHGYHAFSYGTLVGGAFRRATGQSVGEYVAAEISGPLGLDLWLGLPESERSRLVPTAYLPARETEGARRWREGSGIPKGATARLFESFDVYNAPEAASAGWPSTSAVAGARDLARLLQAALREVDGHRLISQRSLEEMCGERSRGIDRVLGVETAFGTGVQLPFPQFPMLGPSSFGHEAAGGSAAIADRDSGLTVGFTTSVQFPMTGASPMLLALLPTIKHCA